MNTHLTLLAIAVALSGITTLHAEQYSGGKGITLPPHYTYLESVYLSGSGFMSSAESYGGQAVLAPQPIAILTPGVDCLPVGHSYSPQEDLYFSGQGFDSSK